MNICKECGKSFLKTTSQRKYKSYCSSPCQTRNWNKRNPEKYRELKKNRWTSKAKFYSCCVCGFERSVDFCHIKWKKDGGRLSKDNVYILCPNHHRLFDRNLLSVEEKSKLTTAQKIGL